MQIKPITIGNVTLKNNVLVAPLAGFSDSAFRSLCYELGAGLCYTEMVSAKGLVYNNQKTKELLRTTENEYIKAVQLFGSEPEIMYSACVSDELAKFDIIDVNFGCPVPKVFNNGEGSALLNNLSQAEKIVAKMVKSNKIITAKMRLGVDKNDFSALNLAKICQDNGVSMITVHARHREDYYGERVFWDMVGKIKSAVKIPVIVNGGLFTFSDCDDALLQSGADGVMLARGVLKNPTLISELSGLKSDKKTVINRHIDLLLEYMPPKLAAVYLRQKLAYYLIGVKGAKSKKTEIFKTDDIHKIREIVNSLDFGN
ncbi:MAG: tRNA dihydrouridine synthase [Christensenellaceae bacterium]